MSVASARADERLWVGALAVGVVVAVVLAQFSWVGFFVGGAIAGLGQRSIRRGVAAGFLTGVVSLAGFFVLLASAGSLDTALGTGQLLYVTAVIPVLYGTLGGLVRGVF